MQPSTVVHLHFNVFRILTSAGGIWDCFSVIRQLNGPFIFDMFFTYSLMQAGWDGPVNYPVFACAAGVKCLVCLSVCLSTIGLSGHAFRVFSCKGSLYTKVKKVACRWSMIDRNGLEARKCLF